MSVRSEVKRGGDERDGQGETDRRGSRAIRVDDRNVANCYANFCRVTGTPEELILDFGLNAQPFGEQTDPVPIHQRVVLNFYTAKRMMAALQVTIERHETAFGLLETNIQKRVVPGANPAT